MAREKTTYVLHTSILLSSPYALLSFEEHNVVLVDVTLDELDRKKDLSSPDGYNAHIAIRILEELRHRSGGSIAAGVSTPGGGTLRVITNYLSESLPEQWDDRSPDNRILRVCMGFAKEVKNLVLVSNSISLRLKADILGIRTEEFKTDQVSERDQQYTGRRDVFISHDAMDEFFHSGHIDVDALADPRYAQEYNDQHQGERGDSHIVMSGGEAPIINEFFTFYDLYNHSRTALGRFDGNSFVRLAYDNIRPYGITPRNRGQRFYQEALLASAADAPLVIAKGPAGTAKTFLSLACGLHRIIGDGKQDGEEFSRILVSRPNIKFDEDIGFLKGTEEEKIEPLIRPITDNLEILTKIKPPSGGKNIQRKNGEPASYMQYLFDTGVITAQALAYMRGRSIPNTWIIIDEAQNMTPLQAFGIISRAGEGSKIILCGDPDQIDNPRLDSRTNGLSFASERLKGSPVCWQVEMDRKECTRSPLASEAIRRLSPKGKAYTDRLD